MAQHAWLLLLLLLLPLRAAPLPPSAAECFCSFPRPSRFPLYLLLCSSFQVHMSRSTPGLDTPDPCKAYYDACLCPPLPDNGEQQRGRASHACGLACAGNGAQGCGAAREFLQRQEVITWQFMHEYGRQAQDRVRAPGALRALRPPAAPHVMRAEHDGAAGLTRRRPWPPPASFVFPGTSVRLLEHDLLKPGC
jgi:hypothetical protein